MVLCGCHSYFGFRFFPSPRAKHLASLPRMRCAASRRIAAPAAPSRSMHSRAPMRPAFPRRAENKKEPLPPPLQPVDAHHSWHPQTQPSQLIKPRSPDEFLKINEEVKPDHKASTQQVSSLEGVPEYELGRRVFISRPTRSATQAAYGTTSGWVLAYQHEDRWTNPMMGWTSTRDPYTNLKLRFDTLEEAIECVTRAAQVLLGWWY